jgi:hypothetical protein
MRRRLIRLLAAAVGEDGTGGIWERLTADSQEVIRLAYVEAGELGHPCLADEHVLLGLLRQQRSHAAALLQAAGLDLASARSELLRVGPTLGPQVDPASNHRTSTKIAARAGVRGPPPDRAPRLTPLVAGFMVNRPVN